MFFSHLLLGAQTWMLSCLRSSGASPFHHHPPPPRRSRGPFPPSLSEIPTWSSLPPARKRHVLFVSLANQKSGCVRGFCVWVRKGPFPFSPLSRSLCVKNNKPPVKPARQAEMCYPNLRALVLFKTKPHLSTAWGKQERGVGELHVSTITTQLLTWLSKRCGLYSTSLKCQGK